VGEDGGVPDSPLHAPVLAWFGAAARDLPWRASDCSPWGVLVSEVMLQQTPVARVLPAWTAWMRRWPEPSDLAAATPGDAVRAWDRLGYPRRALRLHAAAVAVTTRHGGTVPAELDELRALPGVGAYTAAAVASFAYGRRHAVVDTNVRRVQARVVSGTTPGTAGLTAAQTRLAEDLLPDEPATAARWGAAVMELGALVCTARGPRCADCPVHASCAWRAAGRPAAAPGTRPRPGWEGTDRQARGRLLAALRDASGPVPALDLARACPDDETGRRERCLASLVADGLVEADPSGAYRLPGG
jgi:A/G-specific adenine glycosylase